MTSKVYSLYKGSADSQAGESAVFSFTADKVVISGDQLELIFYNKDDSVAAVLSIYNGAKLREIEP